MTAGRSRQYRINDLPFLIFLLVLFVLAAGGFTYFSGVTNNVDVNTINANTAAAKVACLDALKVLDTQAGSATPTSRATRLAICETAKIKNLLGQGVVLLFALPLVLLSLISSLFGGIKRLGELHNDFEFNLATARLELSAMVFSVVLFGLGIYMTVLYSAQSSTSKSLGQTLAWIATALIIIVAVVGGCVITALVQAFALKTIPGAPAPPAPPAETPAESSPGPDAGTGRAETPSNPT